MNWIQVVQGRIWWWAVVNIIMNLWVPENKGNFLACWVFQEKLCSMELVIHKPKERERGMPKTRSTCGKTMTSCLQSCQYEHSTFSSALIALILIIGVLS
jgi:hypothetical protein